MKKWKGLDNIRKILKTYRKILSVIGREAPVMVVMTFVLSVAAGAFQVTGIIANRHIIDDGLRVSFHLAALLFNRQAHTQRILGVVFEQGVGQGGAMASGVANQGDCRHRQEHGLGAAGGIGNVHAVTEQLGH